MLTQSIGEKSNANIDVRTAKLFADARNLAKHPYLVREGDVSDAELSAVLNGLLELFGAQRTPR